VLIQCCFDARCEKKIYVTVHSQYVSLLEATIPLLLFFAFKSFTIPKSEVLPFHVQPSDLIKPLGANNVDNLLPVLLRIS
jgi:hypothetical protein